MYNYSGKDLRNQNFSEQPLQGKNFSSADLRGANFYKAVLRNANFSDAEIQGANFQGADLCGADFTNVSTTKDSSLSRVNFIKSKIRGTVFTNADLNHADFRESESGLNQFWSIFIHIIHILLCFTSAFTSTISITFLTYFFYAPSKKISLPSQIFIGIISTVIIIFLRSCLINYFPYLVLPSVVIGIIAIIIVLAVAVITTANNDKENFTSSIMIGLLLLIVLIITLNKHMFVSFEDSLTSTVFKNLIHDLGSKGTDGGFISVCITGTIGAVFGCWFSQSAITENTQFNWLWIMYVDIVTYGGTLFYNSNLNDASFASATLRGANLKKAKINRTYWGYAKLLGHARIRNSYLDVLSIRPLILRQKNGSSG